MQGGRGHGRRALGPGPERGKAGSGYLNTGRRLRTEKATLRGSETSEAQSRPERTPPGGSRGTRTSAFLPEPSSDHLRGSTKPEGRTGAPKWCSLCCLTLEAQSWARRSRGWIWGWGDWKIPNGVHELWLGCGAWRVVGTAATEHRCDSKGAAGQAKREREPLTGPGQRDAGHCWPLLRALRSGVLRKAWRPRPRELGRHLPELTQERALLVLPTQRTGARGSSAERSRARREPGHASLCPAILFRPTFPPHVERELCDGELCESRFPERPKKKKKSPCVSPSGDSPRRPAREPRRACPVRLRAEPAPAPFRLGNIKSNL